METIKDRMRTERKSLTARINYLGQLIGSDAYRDMQFTDRVLLRSQRLSMKAYMYFLTKRLERCNDR